MKKIIVSLFLAIILLSLGIIIDLFWVELPYEKLNIIQRLDIQVINKELEKCITGLPKEEQKTIGYSNIMSCLDPFSRKLATRIFSIDPARLGFKGPFFSVEPVSDLVKIESREIIWRDKKIDIGVNFLPRLVFEDYEKMNEAMKQEIGKGLFVSSGYRSPGYQANLFLFYLGDENQYSLRENAKWIAMPGYSEHNSVNTAIDFISEEGINGQEKGQAAEDFEKLSEFSWLVNNAARFNFYLTYPKDNPYGVSYEPWHWHWERK